MTTIYSVYRIVKNYTNDNSVIIGEAFHKEFDHQPTEAELQTEWNILVVGYPNLLSLTVKTEIKFP